MTSTFASDDSDGPRGSLAVGARRRRLIIWTIGAILVLAAAVGAVRTWRYRQTHESTDDAQIDGHIVPVLARVGGYVSAVAIEDNATVAAGALLVRIDSTEYAVRLTQSDADVAATYYHDTYNNRPIPPYKYRHIYIYYIFQVYIY